MIACLRINNPLRKDHGKIRYARVRVAEGYNGDYYHFRKCTIPKWKLKFIKKR